MYENVKGVVASVISKLRGLLVLSPLYLLLWASFLVVESDFLDCFKLASDILLVVDVFLPMSGFLLTRFTPEWLTACKPWYAIVGT